MAPSDDRVYGSNYFKISDRQFWKTLVKNASFIGKTLKNKISHIFLIHYENFMASINSLGFFNLSHAFWCEKNHYRGRTLAKHGRFRKTLVKNASFVFSRFLT